MYDPRDMQLLSTVLNHYQELIQRPYLYDLSYLPTESLTPCSSPILLLELDHFSVSTSSYSLSYLFNALHHLHQTIGFIFSVDAHRLTIYLGIKGDLQNCTSLNLIESGLSQLCPTLSLHVIEDSSILLNHLFDASSYSILTSSVTVPPAIPPSNSGDNFLSTFLDLMGTEQSYTAFFLASPHPRAELLHTLDELYETFYLLSGFNQASYNLMEGLSKNTSQTITKGTVHLNGNTNNETQGSNTSCNQGSYTNLSTTTPIHYAETRSINMSVLQNIAKAHVNGNNYSTAKGTSSSLSESYSHAKLSATNKVDNHSINFSINRQEVADSLKNLTIHIVRIQDLLKSPCFSFSSYFCSLHQETALRAAYHFAGLSQTQSTLSPPQIVNTWTPEYPYFSYLFENLEHFHSPCFCKEDHCYSNHTLIKGDELASCFTPLRNITP